MQPIHSPLGGRGRRAAPPAGVCTPQAFARRRRALTSRRGQFSRLLSRSRGKASLRDRHLSLTTGNDPVEIRGGSGLDRHDEDAWHNGRVARINVSDQRGSAFLRCSPGWDGVSKSSAHRMTMIVTAATRTARPPHLVPPLDKGRRGPSTFGTKRPQVQILSPRPVPQVANPRECRTLRAVLHFPAIAAEASKEHEGTPGKAGAELDGQKNTRPPSTK